LPFDLSITLGSFGISALDLSKMYSIISNDGIKVTPYIISSITNHNGDIITYSVTKKYIQEKSQAFLMKTILRDVVQNGTGRRAKVQGLEIAGKTGTTNKYKDAWFCGFSPTIQTIVWFGNDDNSPMRRTETGGGASAPAFAYFYKNYLKIHPEIKRNFEMVEGVNKRNFNNKTEYFTNISPMPVIQKNQIQNKFINQIEF